MKIISLLLISITMIFAINIKHEVKEVNVYLHDVKGMQSVKRQDGRDLYIEYRDKKYYLKKSVSIKKGGLENSLTIQIINGKKTRTKKTRQLYNVKLSCLKSNDVYFNCTD